MGVNCSSKQDKDMTIFNVREDWIKLNSEGWKDSKNLFICQLHFDESDIGGLDGKRYKFVKPSGKPFFVRYTYFSLNLLNCVYNKEKHFN